MVLDPAAADVADLAVDDHHLAVVEVEQIPAVQLERARAQGLGADDHDPVVGDDLDARLAQSPIEVLAAEIDLAADGVDRQADLDAGRDLVGEGGQEGLPDVAGLVAVDQQMDVVGRRRDVVEHPREVVSPVEEGIDRRGDR